MSLCIFRPEYTASIKIVLPIEEERVVHFLYCLPINHILAWQVLWKIQDRLNFIEQKPSLLLIREGFWTYFSKIIQLSSFIESAIHLTVIILVRQACQKFSIHSKPFFPSFCAFLLYSSLTAASVNLIYCIISPNIIL